MSKRADSTNPTTRPDDEQRGDRDRESLEALRNSWVKTEKKPERASSARAGSKPGLSSTAATLRTCCPACLTVFEVSADELTAYDTRVRCGECLGIFDALAHLRRDEGRGSKGKPLAEDKAKLITQGSRARSSAKPGSTDDFRADAGAALVNSSRTAPAESDDGDEDTSLLDATHADYDLYSGEAELPEVAYFDQTLSHQASEADETLDNKPGSESRATGDGKARTLDEASHTSSPSDSEASTIPLDTSVEYITDDSMEEPLTFVYEETIDGPRGSGTTGQSGARSPAHPARKALPKRKKARYQITGWGRIRRSSALRLSVLMLVLASSILLYAYRERDVLGRNTSLRPVLASMCSVLGCQLPALVNLDALRVIRQSIFSHPSIDNALVIDLGFVNEAEFEQPYPELEIRLTDDRGRVITQNDVWPSEYLPQWQPDSLFAAGERLDLSLTVEDPGQTATSFVLQFK